jgi:hypothetical protein
LTGVAEEGVGYGATGEEAIGMMVAVETEGVEAIGMMVAVETERVTLTV